VYSYDNAGNITSKKEYAFSVGTLGSIINTVSYSYGDSAWGDLLTTFKGSTISYDEMGNPDNLYLRGRDYVMTWTAGRRLASMTNSSGNEFYTFTYNDEGIRTSKNMSGITHNYYLSGSQIIAEQAGIILLVYLYDENGSPVGMQFRTDSMAENTFITFWFEKNLQGDIIAVYNESGTKLITYTYDAWGNVTETVNNRVGDNRYATYNPFRYRGYYYDKETGLYYLQSRYYSPEMGRFINADGQLNGGLLGYNQFAYCENNPVMFTDPTGEFFVSTTLICVIAGALIVGTIGGVIGNAYADSQGYTGWDKAECIIIGASVGAVAGGIGGYIAAPAITTATGIAGLTVTSAGISTVAAVGTDFGKLGVLIENSGQQVVDWENKIWHGIQRMAERGVTKDMVELWVRTGKTLQQSGDRILYVTKQGAVVINKIGQVITAYTSKDFDENMKEIVIKLFGR